MRQLRLYSARDFPYHDIPWHRLSFTVKPNIPAPLKTLDELAHNIWISWNYEAIMLFMRLDYDAWLASRQNPVRMLGMVAQEKLEQAAAR